MQNFARGFADFCKDLDYDKTGMAKEKVVVYAETQMDWMVGALATHSRGLPICTIYATLGEVRESFVGGHWR